MDTSIVTLVELEEKVGHRQRVAEGLSNPRIVAPTVQAVHSQFLQKYTKETLAELEKEFFQ